MGVCLYNKENMSIGESSTNSTLQINCNNNTSNKQKTPSVAATTSTQRNNCSDINNNSNTDNISTLREVVGNYKKMRIKDNTHNLRIVGNNNRIRITVNVGNIIIIGNSTKLKIKTNHGHITYTGNDGRIILGEDSTEQLVDYSGCNGILKVQNCKKFSQLSDADKFENNPTEEKTSINVNLNNKTTKEKNVSHRNSLPEAEKFECRMNYENILNDRKSMPKITTKAVCCGNVSSNRVHQLPKTFVHNFSDIVIANSANISISPYRYSY